MPYFKESTLRMAICQNNLQARMQRLFEQLRELDELLEDLEGTGRLS